MRRQRLLQHQQQMAAEHHSAPVGNYDGSSYHADDYSEQYHSEVPTWVNETTSSQWQQPRYAAVLLPC